MVSDKRYLYSRDYWNGNSRDGVLVNGDGFNLYRMSPEGVIIEAYEVYEKDDGEVVSCPLPEMNNIDWFLDLGFEDLEALDLISQDEFERVASTMKAIA